ncbi:uncharacterized protein DDB_G0283697-like isoform X2 [Diorhabda carinulata]|uniref:uncharacterized protein DDB_G0283697-like isoform X2 n=1 Tax=Diorhabda carinulata TaxID=1163345 RepID=UPI0025A1D298|nr:uncharacterized protein DDB_G0283697-like isoform X2 [Diorhabda carinulata]
MNPRRRSHHPRFLNEVLEAIATLKESKGSTKKNIIDQVELLLSKRIKRLRHDSTQIQRALRHGLSSGLIKSKNGKYVLGMNQKDYGAFKKLQELSSGGDLMRQVRRRKGKKKRKRRPRRRRRYSDVSDTEEDDDNEDYDDDDEEVSRGSDSCASQGNGSLEDRGRRRGKKRRKRKRTKRRRRNEIINIHEGGNKTENLKSNKSSEEDSLKMENNDTDIDDMETNKLVRLKIGDIDGVENERNAKERDVEDAVTVQWRFKKPSIIRKIKNHRNRLTTNPRNRETMDPILTIEKTINSRVQIMSIMMKNI